MPSPRDKSPAAGVIPPRLLAVPYFRSPSLGFDGGDLDKCIHTHANIYIYICIHVNIELQCTTHRITLHVQYIYMNVY